MEIKELIALATNYTKNPADRKIKYIVIHYTGNNGDTAANNAEYFRNNHVGASAHYFVDENEIWQSVPDKDRAWHCGSSSYDHPECRNSNSIGIELCSRKNANGDYYFLPATIKNAAKLVRAKMAEYNIPIENIVRHYDVTGKVCPAPFVGEAQAWQAFKKLCQQKDDDQAGDMERYNQLHELPEWAKPTIKKLVNKGIITGDGRNLDLSKDMVRILIYNDRAGLYDD